ncbi:hypothetical protein I7I51_05369 [Histoplasma capsulatum]|uniref:Mitochondrial chaperone BCS1 n=1 Tax=Ajellomyces capsulatus TaxID=5037 RepID=A0A8A1M3D9_AJECA|nr:predicted protein [Histoplasma mississippiense (nom. inval.)]EDN03759.1 predicted protein [Histoplasma mississippiense (nom. inval.)]QSS60569.1 hypothetical protein I7I51_05369 [Histoplasma capsulatum]
MNSFNVAGSLPIHTFPSQISIVDAFFPGFTAISASIQQVLAGNLNSYAHLLCFCGMLLFLGRYAARYLMDLMETYFTSTVHVSYYNEAYDMLIAWVSTQPFAHKARSSLASIGGMQRRAYADDLSNEYKKKPLRFSPWNGSFFFVYRKHLLRFQCVAKETKEDISISCIGGSSQILRDLLSECRADYLKLLQKKTTVFEHHDGEWRKAKARDIRPISTVIMDEDEKKAVLKDIEGFLDERARGWYARRGIPYRRGFLLYGPPGTGKSSFSLSVAGRFELDIYVLNLSSIDDSRLNSLFAQLPPHCVILLENIDAASTSRTEVGETTENAGQGVAGPSQKRKSQGNVSLSALLNALDGVSSQEGRLLIMTTNHIERLDDALIRPVRVDRKVLFQLADEKMSSRLFCTVFKRSDEDDSNPEKKTDAEKKTDDETIDRLAREFAAKIPDHLFSPAEILLSFLLERKQSPTDAVAHADSWVAKASKERGKPENYVRARAIANPTDSFEDLAESSQAHNV